MFPETTPHVVIRDLSRRIFDGRRPRLGTLLPQRLAGDSDVSFELQKNSNLLAPKIVFVSVDDTGANDVSRPYVVLAVEEDRAVDFRRVPL